MICNVCGVDKTLNSFSERRNSKNAKYKAGKLYRKHTCKECVRVQWNEGEKKRKLLPEYIERQKNKLLRWRNNNPERVKELHRQYVKLSKYKKWFSEYRKQRRKNPEIRRHILKLQAFLEKKNIDGITVAYAIKLLKYRNKGIVITEEMISLKQAQVAMLRIKKMLNVIKKIDEQKNRESTGDIVSTT